MPNLIKLCGAGGEGWDGLFTDSELQYIFNILLCICSKLKKKGFNTPIQCFVTRFYKVKIYLNK